MHRSRRRFGLALLALPVSIPAIAQAQHEPMRDQSPIDIARTNTCVTTLPRLVATRRPPVREVWSNTGSPDEEATIRIASTPPEGELALGGKAYHLRQYHFHAPAEHKIEGSLAAMEIHYVFEADDGYLAVIAQLVTEGAYNSAFNPLLAAMPDSKSLSVTIESSDPLGHFLRPWLEQPRSFRYTGSLTTPPFTTGVSWVVLAQPIAFSTDQMARFRRIFPHGNSREVQNIDGRTVRTDVADFSRRC
ncbi:MAG TPA: carbonic anhydrase family protein [Allosphingosinicella sp.]|nr:carbonic anhydrase family protein [Allosphingosinicella sp.]